jgi:hypothetical protein
LEWRRALGLALRSLDRVCISWCRLRTWSGLCQEGSRNGSARFWLPDSGEVFSERLGYRTGLRKSCGSGGSKQTWTKKVQNITIVEAARVMLTFWETSRRRSFSSPQSQSAIRDSPPFQASIFVWFIRATRKNEIGELLRLLESIGQASCEVLPPAESWSGYRAWRSI